MDYDSYRKRFEQSNEAADLYTVWAFMSLHKSFWIKREHVFEKTLVFRFYILEWKNIALNIVVFTSPIYPCGIDYFGGDL